MKYVYKLNFASEKEYLTLRATLEETNEEGQTTFIQPTERIVVGGFQPIAATYNADGTELTPASIGESYEVDILTNAKLAKLNKYKCGLLSSQWHMVWTYPKKDLTYVY